MTLRRYVLTALLTMGVLPMGTALAQSISGDWHGTLVAGPQELRLALHISGDAKAGFAATMDSLDQGAMAIPVSSIKLNGSNLKFEIEKIGGTFDGKVNSDFTEMSGTWSQGGGELPLKLQRGAAEEPKKRTPKASDIDGDWQGALEAGGSKLRLVLHVVNYEDGLSATLDSVDQNANGMRVTSIARNGSKLTFELKAIGGSFEGTLDAGLTTLTGTWTQGGNSTPLVLKRAKS